MVIISELPYQHWSPEPTLKVVKSTVFNSFSDKSADMITLKLFTKSKNFYEVRSQLHVNLTAYEFIMTSHL